MWREDDNMPFMLRYENVAWYENGKVKILDRRIYPIKTEYVICESYGEVADAIKGMVTQSGGPYIAAAMGMVLAVYEAVRGNAAFESVIKDAAFQLSHARPTTSVRMAPITEHICRSVISDYEKGLSGDELIEKAFSYAIDQANKIYVRNKTFGKNIAAILPQNATILTHCYGEAIISGMLAALKERSNPVHLICDETRPYFQGARLTASVAADMGFKTSVICDGMSAFIMKEKNVDAVVLSSDLISMDGYIVNKVGTFSCALAAKHWGIPFYAAGNPNRETRDHTMIRIEERDPDQVLEYMGIRLTVPGVSAYYPAFDITPPDYCTGIITDKGIMNPHALSKYFED